METFYFTCLVSLLLGSSSLLLVEGKYVEGHLTSKEDWHFITRFCFLAEQGAIYFTFEYPVSYSPQSILLYFDDQWENVYSNKHSTDCNTKKSVLQVENGQVITLTNSFTWSGCKVREENGVQMYRCKGGRTFVSTRERWWFVAVSRCNPDNSTIEGVTMTYTLHMTNGDQPDWLHYELSADQFYIAPVNIAFLLIYVGMVVLSVIFSVILWQRQLFHTTYKLYLTAVLLWTMHLLLMSIAYGRYASTGIEETGTKIAARAFAALSELFFLLMLLLVALGYTITRGSLSNIVTAVLAVFMSIYTITFATLFIYEALYFDEGKVLYLYEGPPGYGLVALRLIAWVWFLVATFMTLASYPKKALFYIPYFMFYTVWFWMGPIIVLIAMFAMAKWVREKTVNGVDNFVALGGHLFFLILTRPQAANKNFPYHVRTTQIGVTSDNPHLKNQNGVPLGVGIDGFSAYAYAPSYDVTPVEQTDLNGMYSNSSKRAPVEETMQNNYTTTNNSTDSSQRPGQLPPLAASREDTSLPPAYETLPGLFMVAESRADHSFS